MKVLIVLFLLFCSCCAPDFTRETVFAKEVGWYKGACTYRPSGIFSKNFEAPCGWYSVGDSLKYPKLEPK